MGKGLFITFEGIDGCGKSTQLYMLGEYLKQKGYGTYVTKEPGDANYGSNVGPGVRSILFKDPGLKSVAPGVADLLFLSDHVQNSSDIKEALRDGKVVLSDRYADSQFAYSASPTKQAPEWANRYFKEQYGPIPDITLLFVVRGIELPRAQGGKEDIAWTFERANARRGAEAGKQAAKAWNDIEEQRKIQDAYIKLLSRKLRTRQIHVWEQMTVQDVHRLVIEALPAFNLVESKEAA